MRYKAFTLIEFLVTVAIIGILAAVLFPVLYRPHRGGYAPRSTCQTNLKLIAFGVKGYVQDYDERFPPVAAARSGNWAGSLQPYVTSWQIFHCPSVPKKQTKTTDYYYNARLARVKEKNIHWISNTILLGEAPDDSPTSYALSQLPAAWLQDPTSPARRHLDGANYAFADGHVKWLRPDKIFNAQNNQQAATFAIQ